MVAYLDRADGDRLAYLAVHGAGPTVVWLGGFNSDMQGTKAEALADWAARAGRGYVRFDYAGHGRSSGIFTDGTISRWRGDALAVVDGLTSGQVVLVGSSMGGWIATLVALARPHRIAGLVLVAPAADMTDKLIEPELTAEAWAALSRDGVWIRPSPYGSGDPITRVMLETGAAGQCCPDRRPAAHHCACFRAALMLMSLGVTRLLSPRPGRGTTWSSL